ncbi:hypothetical protein ABQE22_03880 [Enterococcus durans]|uniref:hypothetical protein n=1 Tax=Enterococcus durans TaxID=53345 RepID=UPI0032E4A914
MMEQEIELFTKPEEVIQWIQKSGLSFDFSVEDAEILLGYLEGHDYTIGQDSRYTVCVNDDEHLNLYEALNRAIHNIKAEMRDFERISEDEERSAEVIPADPDVRNFTYTIFDGKLYFRENSEMIRQEVTQSLKERIRFLHEIRQITRELIDIQMEGCSEEELAAKQKELNSKYDAFIEQYGHITSKANKTAFRDDSDYPLLCSLEEVNEDGEVKKADMFYKQTIKAKIMNERVETAVEALNVSVKAELSTSPVGSMIKLENLFNGLHENVEFLEKKIEQYHHDLMSSKEEYEKPFTYEKELQEKLARQFELNAQLDLENAKVADADLGGLDESKDSHDSNVAEREEDYRTNQDGKSR